MSGVAIGDRIRQLRERHDPRLSQERLAGLAGMSRAWLVHIENNRRSPRLEDLEKISCALNIPLPILLDQNGSTAAVPGKAPLSLLSGRLGLSGDFHNVRGSAVAMREF